MKRKKMIAGIAIALLCGVGVYGSSNRKKFLTYFYIPNGGGCATSPDVPFVCTPDSSGGCTTTINGVANVQLYGVNPGNGADCTSPLGRN